MENSGWSEMPEGELTGNKEADGNAEEGWAMYAGIKAK